MRVCVLCGGLCVVCCVMVLCDGDCRRCVVVCGVLLLSVDVCCRLMCDVYRLMCDVWC